MRKKPHSPDTPDFEDLESRPSKTEQKKAQLTRWVDRLVAQGDGSLNDFVRQFPAAERHTLRQHVMRVQKATVEQAPEDEQAELLTALENYVNQVAILSE